MHTRREASRFIWPFGLASLQPDELFMMTINKALTSRERPSHVGGIDTLRFVLAVIVVIFHGGAPPLFAGHDPRHLLVEKVSVVWSAFFNGEFAVVAFFFISGLCIHLPYVRGRFDLWSFLASRAIRISLPAAIAIIVTWTVHFRHFREIDGVPVWSLYCELAYYAVYPVLLPILRSGLAHVFVAASYILAILLLSFIPPAKAYGYAGHGFIITTLIGLPVWLLGATYAIQLVNKSGELVLPNPDPPLRWIWILRLCMMLVGCVTLVASRTHHLDSSRTLTAASPLLYFWVRDELRRFRFKPPLRVLEYGGKFSYSMYLIHFTLLFLVDRTSVAILGQNLEWTVRLLAVIIGSFLFYLAAEYPSHRLARLCKRYLCTRSLKENPSIIVSEVNTTPLRIPVAEL